MKIIVGLGNPGDSYQDTRHNIGFMVIDKLARDLSRETISWGTDAKLKAHLIRIGDLLLVKPQTFMNNSGHAVATIMTFYKAKPSDIWIVHDDIDLPLGKIRIREKGGSAGHNGVNSIIEHLKTDAFIRFRLGIGRGREVGSQSGNAHARHQSVISFVLSHFNQSEAGLLKHLVKHGAEAVQLALEKGTDKAMNRFN